MKHDLLITWTMALILFPVLGCVSVRDNQTNTSLEKNIVEFVGKVTAGSDVTRIFGERFSFLLLPIDHGWLIQVRDERGTEDISRLTPPYHGPNPRLVEGWHFRNSDNSGPNEPGEKNVNAPQEFREFIFSPEMGRTIDSPEVGRKPTFEEMKAVGQFGCGSLRILDYRLKDLEPGKRASFEWMRFHVTLSWPRS
ncbi:hypothetical protein KKA39_03350 [Patescibacteria group bacterium]|nr:hypothetical protein [Patescibacteria group bacterium]